MAKKSTRIPFLADRVYHIFNRGNNREKIFYSPSQYQMFLELYKKFPGTLAETYCYCLIPNHFHFLIRVNEEAKGKDFVNQIRKWMISYAMTVNRQIDRRGHLFTRPINRIEVTDEAYLRHLIRYIHLNPVKHGVSNSFESYPYSSYRSFMSKNQDQIISRDCAMGFFNNDLLDFLDFHRENSDENEISGFILEEKR